MNEKQKVINIAKSYIGYIEDNNNFNIFADKVNKSVQNMSWCCTFIQAIFKEANIKLPSDSCKCSVLYQAMQKISKAEVGDLIFFVGKGVEHKIENINHIGLVIEVGNRVIKTIEGNTRWGNEDRDGVRERIYDVGNERIFGYARPKYNNEVEPLINDDGYKEGVICGDSVNVRCGPGTEYERIGIESRPYKFLILGKEKDRYGVDWYIFNYKGDTAYIISKYVNILL